jgi:hypothetical protein
LITEDEFECYVPAGYPGSKGELWFVRLGPPIEPVDYHVILYAANSGTSSNR